MADTEDLDVPAESAITSDTVKLGSYSPQELTMLCAADPILFGHVFFPRAFRQESPQMHYDMSQLVLSQHRHIGVMVYRGGAKTTLLRNATAHGVAYGMYRTILYVSEAQDHAIRSVKWLKNAIDYNRPFADFFGLSPKMDPRTGRPVKWTDEWIIVHHKTMNIDISIIALGIHGQTRGLNIDDYRPDLIIVDDPSDEENTKTPEARKKTADVFFGALEKSLAPMTENPMAKIVLLQTPLVENDLIMQCQKDPQFKCVTFSCFDENGKSTWEQRFPTEQLLKDKASHVARNMLKLWMREMECKVISDDTTAFRSGWLQIWIPEMRNPLARRGFYLTACDPTPPPKDWTKEPSKELDDAIVQTWHFCQEGRFLVAEWESKQPDPDSLCYELFSQMHTFKSLELCLETINFARYLKHYLEAEMRRRNVYFAIHPVEDYRQKTTRIIQALKGPASAGMMYVHESHTSFREQFESYPHVKHDDRLDCASIAFIRAEQLTGHGLIIDGTAELHNPEPLDYDGACP